MFSQTETPASCWLTVCTRLPACHKALKHICPPTRAWPFPLFQYSGKKPRRVCMCKRPETPATNVIPKMKDVHLPIWKAPNWWWQQPARLPTRGHFTSIPQTWAILGGHQTEHCLAITKVDFRHYSHIYTSHSVVYVLTATWSDREELQLLMAPITAIIIVCIELNWCFSSIFIHMTWKLISHWHFFHNKAKSFKYSLKGSK